MGCEVQKCCCGCSLKTGSTMIGIIEAVLSATALVMVITFAAYFTFLEDSALNDTKATQGEADVKCRLVTDNGIELIDVVLLKDSVLYDTEDSEGAAQMACALVTVIIITALSVMAVILTMQVIFAILLACGASDEEASLIKAWLIYSTMFLVFTIIVLIVGVSMAIAYGEIEAVCRSLATLGLVSALKIYCHVVVRSYHLELTRPGFRKFRFTLYQGER